MTSTLQTDREFERSVGIQPDRDSCGMCQLYAIERTRRLEDMIEAAACVADHRVTIQEQHLTIRMWRLATFAATVMMLLFAWSSVHRGVK